MKALRCIMLVLCAVSIAALVIILCVGMSRNGGTDMAIFNFFKSSGGMNWNDDFDGEAAPTGEVSFAAGDVKSIEIGWIGGSLTVERHSGDEVRVVQTPKLGEIPEDRLLAYRLDEDGVLHLREGRSRRVTSHIDTDVTVYLPEGFGFAGYVNISGVSTEIGVPGFTASGSVLIHTTSGGISASDISAASAELESTSGGITAERLNIAGKLEVSSTSGGIELRDASAEEVEAGSTSGGTAAERVTASGKLKLSTASGGLRATACAAKDTDCSTVSGKLKLDGSFGTVAASTASGGLDVSLASSPEQAELSTISGRAMLRLPAAISGFSADCSTVSGGVNCEFPTVKQGKNLVYGDGSAALSVSTVSGAIDIVQE